MFPSVFIEQSLTNDKEKTEDNGVDFLFDYETGQHVMKGSVLNECGSLRKVRQYIETVLRTPSNVYKDYIKGETESFGLSIYKYIGEKTLPMGYINSELKREVTEHLLKHPLISEVKDWKGKREKRGLSIEFTVVLRDSSILEMEHVVGGIDV